MCDMVLAPPSVIPALGRLRPDDRDGAVSRPSRLGAPRRPARALRRDRARRRHRSARSRAPPVAASWAFERGIGLHAPLAAREVVVETGRRRALLDSARWTTCRAAPRRASVASRSSSITAATSPGAAIGCFPAGEARAATSASAATACAWKDGSRPCATPSTWCSWAAARASAPRPPGRCRRRPSSWRARRPRRRRG